MQDIEKMKLAVLKMTDPSANYTLNDFNKEFSIDNTSFDFKKEIKYLNTSENENPKYETQGSSGFDIRANLPEDFILEPLKRFIVPTGLFFELPENIELQIRPRSGLAAKFGVTVLNTPGTIDSDYRGELKVILINLGSEDYLVQNGDRVAQGVFAPVMAENSVNLKRVLGINKDTSRGEGGFGHTGQQ